MIESERLIFRRFTLDDLPKLIEQRTDPEVSKYLGGTKLQNPRLSRSGSNSTYRATTHTVFGMCAMLWKPTGEMIGSAGLQPLDGTDDIEVGYSMIKEYWGQGIGTEAARAWLMHGFTNHGLDRIVAVAQTENWPSRRIMEKAWYALREEGGALRCGMRILFDLEGRVSSRRGEMSRI
jgi:RimJ/RimL family protein N-acetyltransferase